MDYQDLIDELVRAVPAIRAKIEAEPDYVAPILPHVFFGDLVLPYVIEMLGKPEAHRSSLERVFGFLETMAVSDAWVRNVLAATVLEGLNSGEDLSRARPFMGPQTSAIRDKGEDGSARGTTIPNGPNPLCRGDVFQVPLGHGVNGYGRIMDIDKGFVLVQLYPIDSPNAPDVSGVEGATPLLTLWSTDWGVRRGEWTLIGHVDIGDFVPPHFVRTDEWTGSRHIMIGRGPEELPLTAERLATAQPYGVFGHEGLRLRYWNALQQHGLMPPE